VIKNKLKTLEHITDLSNSRKSFNEDN